VLPAREIDEVLDLRKMTEIGFPAEARTGIRGMKDGTATEDYTCQGQSAERPGAAG